MKNQPFHQRKIRIHEAPKPDFDQLKARTINALNKLGQQKFSTEPGGYSLENWARVVNVLLDEFEESAGTARLSPEYLTSRHDLSDLLSKPVLVTPIDEDVSKLRANMSEIESKIGTERDLIASRISELKAEQAKYSGELDRERRRDADAVTSQSSDSLFNRLLGRSKAQTKSPGSRVDELESKLALLPNEVLEQQKQLRMIDLRSPGSRFAEEWSRLDSMQTRLKELEQERLDRIQLVKERAEVTGSVAGAISRIQ